MAAMREIRESVGRYAAGFDAALVSGADAEVILADAIAAENILAAIRSLVAARVAECASWKREGDRSAARQLARKAGIPLGRAQEALSTAERLASQPELDGAPSTSGPHARGPRAASGAIQPHHMWPGCRRSRRRRRLGRFRARSSPPGGVRRARKRRHPGAGDA